MDHGQPVLLSPEALINTLSRIELSKGYHSLTRLLYINGPRCTRFWHCFECGQIERHCANSVSSTLFCSHFFLKCLVSGPVFINHIVVGLRLESLIYFSNGVSSRGGGRSEPTPHRKWPHRTLRKAGRSSLQCLLSCRCSIRHLHSAVKAVCGRWQSVHSETVSDSVLAEQWSPPFLLKPDLLQKSMM